MKTLLTLTILTFIFSGCSNNHSTKIEKPEAIQTSKVVPKNFAHHLADFPRIKDSTQFMDDLRQIFKLEVEENPVQHEQQKITAYKKVKLYGSDLDYYLIEYDWIAGCMATFPWQFQVLLTSDGKLVKVLSGLRFDFVTIFPKHNPFLLIVDVTGRGNGGHKIYKINADTLENVYEGYYDYDVQTYDGHEDMSVFEPAELKTSFTDINKDGFNDIVFTGQEIMLGKRTKTGEWYDGENGKDFTIENPAGRRPVKYVFLYDKRSGHFKALKNYTRTY